MRIDCSKISNKGDALAIIAVFVIMFLFGGSIALAIYGKSFLSGFSSATIIWKWHDWIYKPIDRLLDLLWRDDAAI